MKIIKHLIIATLLFSSHSIFSMQALKKKQEQIAALSIPKIPSVPKELTSRPLLIFFDPSHAEGDPQFSALSFGTTIPIATALLQALSSKNAILIASSGLWNYILDVIERPQAELSDDTMMIQTLWKSCNFDPSEWLIYQTRDQKNVSALLPLGSISTPIGPIAPDKYTMIFIPTSGIFKPYIDRFDTIIEGTDPYRVSDGELSLGIKINNLNRITKKISPEQGEKGMTVEFKKMFSTIAQSDDLALCLKNILFTREDFSKELKAVSPKKAEIPWDIYLIGHGLSSKSSTPKIAGMSPDSFTKLLNFLNDKITTRSFFYDSCYAGSNISPYQQAVSVPEIRNKEFNFIIIASTLFNLPSSVLIGTFNFSQYFKLLNDYFDPKRNILLRDVISTLTPYKLLSSRKFNPRGELERAMQIPMVRYPHVGWFSIVDLDKNFFRLNNMAIMRAISEGKNKINIPKNASLILLETRYIPIPIVIAGDKMPLLMPIEFNASYFFKEINAPDVAVDSTDMFSEDFLVETLKRLNLKTYNSLNHNVFFIETLHMKLAPGNPLHWANSSTFKDVIINPMQSIRVTYAPADKPQERGLYNLGTLKWESLSSSANLQQVKEDFLKEKEAIRKASTLPEPGKEEQPTAITPLSHGYIKMLEELEGWKQSLPQEKQERLERLEKLMKQKPPEEEEDVMPPLE